MIIQRTLLDDKATMHDNEPMAAIHGTRMSPPQLSNDVRNTIIKRPFEPLAKPNVDSIQDNFKFPQCEDNKIDDDDFSDHDSHYSADFEDCDFDMGVAEEEKSPDITQRLLNFADMVNQDIKKFFGRKKDEESCDIYEDKWVTTKSGRELYYADLLRIAHGDSVELNKHLKEITSPISPNNNNDSKYRYTGKMDTKAGLGPLNELFDFGLRKLKKVKRPPKFDKKIEDSVPMQHRKLPESFWKEPGTNIDSRMNGLNALNSSRAPDFSDLLQSWARGEEEEFSSSEMSMGSSESAMEQI